MLSDRNVLKKIYYQREILNISFVRIITEVELSILKVFGSATIVLN